MYRATLSPPVAGLGPWECAAPELSLGAPTMAAMPPGTTIEIRQIGDFAASRPLILALT